MSRPRPMIGRVVGSILVRTGSRLKLANQLVTEPAGEFLRSNAGCQTHRPHGRPRERCCSSRTTSRLWAAAASSVHSRSSAICRSSATDPSSSPAPPRMRSSGGPVDETLAGRLPEGTEVDPDSGSRARLAARVGAAERSAGSESRRSSRGGGWTGCVATVLERGPAWTSSTPRCRLSRPPGPRRASRAETGTPWIADLRDPWALDDWLVFPTGAHRRLELWTMRRVCRRPLRSS